MSVRNKRLGKNSFKLKKALEIHLYVNMGTIFNSLNSGPNSVRQYEVSCFILTRNPIKC